MYFGSQLSTLEDQLCIKGQLYACARHQNQRNISIKDFLKGLLFLIIFVRTQMNHLISNLRRIHQRDIYSQKNRVFRRRSSNRQSQASSKQRIVGISYIFGNPNLKDQKTGKEYFNPKDCKHHVL